MLAGRNDLKTLTEYVPRMKDFSDDGGKTQPGAYGKRWRGWFHDDGDPYIDQLPWAIRRLKADHNDRRVIIQMYDANHDQDAADYNGRDIPCNIVAAPWVDVYGKLSMSIFCRSNDIVLGAYGANAVHFAFLLEYLAAGIGVEVGTMFQVSNNYHAYLDTMGKCGAMEDLYATPTIIPQPLFTEGGETLKQFDEDLTIFFDEPSASELRSSFLRRVACPMVLAHRAFKKKDDPQRFEKAYEIIANCIAPDWRYAGTQWIERRQRAAERAKDDGVNHET